MPASKMPFAVPNACGCPCPAGAHKSPVGDFLVSSPKWQTFISSRLTLSAFETLKEPLFIKPESILKSDGARS